jgi:hypothetical protein
VAKHPALAALREHFPKFVDKVQRGRGAPLEHVLKGLAQSDVMALEGELGVALPHSYKQFLRCTRGFWLMGGVVQLGKRHPFFHDFPALDELTPLQRAKVAARGGSWPPPSQGMLCFAEFFLEADGDQVLFDVARPSRAGEYPVMYYAHEVPAVRRIAGSFRRWLEDFLDYREFKD